MEHADLVASDFLTDRAMNELCGLIQELPYDDLKELGALKHEVNEVDFSQAGLHKLWHVLLSSADRGSCAHKCVC